MNVFISQSGDLAKAVAEGLAIALRRIVPTLKPFVSSRDISKGEVWLPTLLRRLDESSAGIVCVTRESLRSDWLLFEAGALAKYYGRSRVCTLLIDVVPLELEQPLSLFQATSLRKDDLLRLFKDLHQLLESPLWSENELEEQFNAWWPDFETTVRTALAAPVRQRSEIHLLTEELLLPVIYREAQSGDLETVFHWLHIAKQRRVADLEGALGFVEACLARVTGKRGAQQSLRQLTSKGTEHAPGAYLEWLFLQFAGDRGIGEAQFDAALIERCPESVQRTAHTLIGLWHLREGATAEAERRLRLADPDNIRGDAHDHYRALALGILCFALGEGALGERHFDLAKSPHTIPNEGYPFISLIHAFDRSFVTTCIGRGERLLSERQIRDFRGYAWVLTRYIEILRQYSPALKTLIARSETWRTPLNQTTTEARLLQLQKRLVASSGAPLLS